MYQTVVVRFNPSGNEGIPSLRHGFDRGGRALRRRCTLGGRTVGSILLPVRARWRLLGVQLRCGCVGEAGQGSTDDSRLSYTPFLMRAPAPLGGLEKCKNRV